MATKIKKDVFLYYVDRLLSGHPVRNRQSYFDAAFCADYVAPQLFVARPLLVAHRVVVHGDRDHSTAALVGHSV